VNIANTPTSAAAFVLVLVSLGSATAKDRLYHFRDEHGVSHFSNVPADSRYKPAFEVHAPRTLGDPAHSEAEPGDEPSETEVLLDEKEQDEQTLLELQAKGMRRSDNHAQQNESSDESFQPNREHR